MRLGIYCGYWPGPVTKAVLVLAEVAEEQGHQVDIFPVNRVDSPVGSRFDKPVIASPWDSLFAWVEHQDRIVFVEPAPSLVLQHCRKHKKVTYLVTPSEPSPNTCSLAHEYDAVVAAGPYAAMSAAVRMPNSPVIGLPWWVGWPQVYKQAAEPIQKVLVQGYFRNGRRWPKDWFRYITEVVFSHDGLSLQLLGGRGGLVAGDSLFVRKKLLKEKRFSILPATTDEQRMAALSDADLVLNGDPGADLGWLALESQTCGSVVMLWDSPQYGWMRDWPLVRTARYAEAASDHENIARYCEELDAQLSRKTAVAYSIERLQSVYSELEPNFRGLWETLFTARPSPQGARDGSD